MKRILSGLILAGILILAGCGKTHRITVSYGRDLLVECPDSAKTGDTVTIKTEEPSYGKMHVRVDGMADFGTFTSETTYEFFMPDEDVDLVVWSGWGSASAPR